MKLTQQGEFKKSEAVKLYHLIMQVVPAESSVVSREILQRFLGMIGDCVITAEEILQKIVISGKQLNEQYFGISFSQYFQQKMSSFKTLISYNQSIRDLLRGDYFKKSQLYELTKYQHCPPIYDDKSVQSYIEQIQIFHEDIVYRNQFSSFSQMLKKMNHCLAGIYLSNNSLFVTFCLQKCKFYLQNGMIDKAIQSVSIQGLEEDSFKFLLLVTQAMKYDVIKDLVVRSGLYRQENWQFLILTVTKYYKTDKYVSEKTLLSAFISNFMTHSTEFIYFLISQLQQDKTVANQFIISPLVNIQQSTYIKYVIVIYSYICRTCLNRPISNGISFIVACIEQFALKVLMNGSSETCELAIRLISETVKHNFGSYNQERQISFVLKALSADESSAGLISAVLQVCENALKFNNQQAIWMFTRKKSCMQFIKMCLVQPFINQSDSFHCQCMQIIYELIRPEYTTLFEEYGLIQVLQANLNTDTNPNNIYFFTFTSKIMSKLSVQSCASERTINLMKSESVLHILLVLVSGVYRQDYIMDSFLNGSQFMYFDTQILINVLMALFMLNQKSSKMAVKLFDKDTNLVYSLKIIEQLIKKIAICPDRNYIRTVLKEEITISKEIGQIKIYKLLFLINEAIMFSASQTSSQTRKTLFASRTKLLQQFYKLFTYNELQNEGIPILIQYQILASPDQTRSMTITRLLPAKFNFQSLKHYIQQLVKDYFSDLKEMPQIYLRELGMNVDIKNQVEYRKLMSRVIKNHPNEYHVKIKAEIDENSLTSERLSYFNQISSYSANTNPYATARSTVIRHSPARGQQTDYINRQRNTSPSPIRSVNSNRVNQIICESCRGPTTGRQRLCQECNRL